MAKTFVLRPNALLASSNSTQRFGKDNVVVVPMAVLDEVHQMRSLSLEKAKIRREIMEYICAFSFEQLSNGGVKQENGSILKVVTNFKEESLGQWENDEFLTSYQKRTLKVCIGLRNTGANVVLVTNNHCLQMRAESLNIRAEKFKDEIFPSVAEQYTGRTTVDVSIDVFDSFYANKSIKIKDVQELKTKVLFENQYVLFHCLKKQENGISKVYSAYGKVSDDNIVQVFMHKRHPYDIKPMNDGQRFLFNALYDEAPLTVVKGGAGTGKTISALAYALDEWENKKYSRILVTRKADFSAIGYLPGEIEQKMGPYLAGINDNLSILLNNGSKKNKGTFYENGNYFFEKKIIQIKPIELLRGSSIMDAVFIIDETQNMEPDIIKTVVTRAAKGSKLIFLGDPSQIDNPNLTERYNGLVYLSEKMKGSKFCTQITLDDKESVRSDLARYASQTL